MYVEEGLSVPEIARDLKVNPKSVYNYVNANDKQWEKERDALSKRSNDAPEILKQAMEGLIKKVDEISQSEGQPEILADAIAKIGDSISKIQKVINSIKKEDDRLGSVLFVVKDFGGYARAKAGEGSLPPDFFEPFGQLLDGYREYAIEKYSK